MTKRGFILVAVFGVGVGLGCAAAPLVVPKASAQQAAALTKWEYSCADTPDDTALTKFGAEGWELATVEPHDRQVGGTTIASSRYCFKRPKL